MPFYNYMCKKCKKMEEYCLPVKHDAPRCCGKTMKKEISVVWLGKGCCPTRKIVIGDETLTKEEVLKKEKDGYAVLKPDEIHKEAEKNKKFHAEIREQKYRKPFTEGFLRLSSQGYFDKQN